MLLGFKILMPLYVATITANAQSAESTSLNIGDKAPQLKVSKWLKGTPILEFEKGKIYVVEFWATWCIPCINVMPHLSTLAKKYKDKVVFLGIDVLEKNGTSMLQVEEFVHDKGVKMQYHVAAEDSNFMETTWLIASGERDNGIPNSFIVDAEGRLAWIGDPKGLQKVLTQMVNNTFSIQQILAKRNLNKKLKELDVKASRELNKYTGDWYKHDYFGKPDSVILTIDELVRNEPKLKFAPRIAAHTFSALLKINPHKAYEFGKEVIMTPTYEDPPYNLLIGTIAELSDKFDLPKEIYELCAEIHQEKINQYRETIDISNTYRKMGEWYSLAGERLKAIYSQEKAIESMKRKKNFTKDEMAALQACLKIYKDM